MRTGGQEQVLYRILEKLLIDSRQGITINPGDVHGLETLRPETVARLLARGSISPVRAPALDTFPGWQLRSARLEAAGIDTIAFISMPAADIVRRTYTSDLDDWPVELVEEWQMHIKALLGIDGGINVTRR